MDRDKFQGRVFRWVEATFGLATLTRAERVRRFLEEAIELAQAEGLAQADVDKLAAYVYTKPAGTPEQELGGVGVTLLAYAASAGLSAEDCEVAEFERVQQKDAAHFRERHNKKADAGVALRTEPLATPPTPEHDLDGDAVERLGKDAFIHCGSPLNRWAQITREEQRAWLEGTAFGFTAGSIHQLQKQRQRLASNSESGALFIGEEEEIGGGYHRHWVIDSLTEERDWSEPYKKSGAAWYRKRVVRVPYPPAPETKRVSSG